MFDSYKVCSPLAYLHWLRELEVFSSLFAWFSLTSLAKENNPCFFVALLQLKIKISPRLCILRNLYIGNFHRKCLERVLVHPYKQKMKMPFCNKTSLRSWRHLWAGERRRSRQLPRGRICERRSRKWKTLHRSSHGVATRVHGFAPKTKATRAPNPASYAGYNKT